MKERFGIESLLDDDNGNDDVYRDVIPIKMFNIINRNSAEWRRERARFNDIINFKSQGRDDGITFGSFHEKMGIYLTGTSCHCPYLTFNVYYYFSREGDKILDPFAGGIPRGAVASRMKRFYTGIDIRDEQIESNRECLRKLGITERVAYLLGDSEIILDRLEPESFDLIYTSPPFLGCEVYSDCKGDLSNMDWDSFKGKYKNILIKSADKLKKLGNFVIEVGDGRDGSGFFYGQPEFTHRVLSEYGLKMYNRFCIIDPIGTRAFTGGSAQRNGKFVKNHKLMYHFIKKGEKI